MNFLIVDDEELARKDLKKALGRALELLSLKNVRGSLWRNLPGKG